MGIGNPLQLKIIFQLQKGNMQTITFCGLITPAVGPKWCTLFEIIFWNNFAGLNMCCSPFNAADFEGRWVGLSFNINCYKDETPPAPPNVHHCLYHIWCTQGPGGLGLSSNYSKIWIKGQYPNVGIVVYLPASIFFIFLSKSVLSSSFKFLLRFCYIVQQNTHTVQLV